MENKGKVKGIKKVNNMQKPDVLKRLAGVAGEDFNSRGCRVTNPRITARESIEIADYVHYLESLLFKSKFSEKPKLPEPPPVRVVRHPCN